MSKLYTVWRADRTEDEGSATYRCPFETPDAASAAKKYAAEIHASGSGWEWTWPIDFNVRDSQTGRVLKFSVQREAVPEFWCGTGVEVKPGPHDPEFYPGHPDDKPCCPCGHPFGETGPCAGCNCADGAP
jgi:hypothetical protein